MRQLRKIFFGLWLFGMALNTQAASIASFSPLGLEPEVHNIKVGFKQQVVAIGQTDAPAPVLIECNGIPLQGDAKWADGHYWQLDLPLPLNKGLSCQAKVNSDFLDVKGQALTQVSPFQFNTGDIKFRVMAPWDDNNIAEDQVFVLKSEAPINVSSLVESTVCSVEGLGEQVPVRLIEGNNRQVILEQVGHEKDPSNVHLVQCSRNLPSQAKVALIINSGVESESGWKNQQSQAMDFTVREPFTASMECSRLNAKAHCSPLADIRVLFSSRIKAQDANLIKLTIDGKEFPSDLTETGDIVVGDIAFKGPFPANSTVLITLPKGLRDDSGRTLANADKFPLNSKIDHYPPLLKFASGNFGIIESYAEAPVGTSLAQQPALLPVTVRNIEKDFKLNGLRYEPGAIQILKIDDAVDALHWINRVEYLARGKMTHSNILRYLEGVNLDYSDKQEAEMDVRNYPLLENHKQVIRMDLPSMAESKNETEVIGVPITKPGFYVLEAKSATLGKGLTEKGTPMYVRTSVLVTNLAVHLKCSPQSVFAWVTRLHDAQPVANADVKILTEGGKLVAQGKTNEQGVFETQNQNNRCDEMIASAHIGAEHPQAFGEADYSFVSSRWNEGIQRWMFNLPNSGYDRHAGAGPRLITHTILDRTLLRAGETVAMKHFVRLQTSDGLVAPVAGRDALPSEVRIVLEAMDEEITLPVKWQKSATGGFFAETRWDIPKNSKNGIYQVVLRHDGQVVDTDDTTEFRVEEFKLPLLNGSIQASSEQQVGGALINPKVINADIQVNYIVGGGASQLPIQVSAMRTSGSIQFEKLADYQFSAYDLEASETQRKLILDKKSIVLDENGHANINIDNLGTINEPTDVVIEVSFMDPNGQIQTISQSVSILPAAIMAGIRTQYMYELGKEGHINVITVNPQGQVQANVPVTVKATRSHYDVVRKRLLGGFYSYDIQRTSKDLGSICQGVSNQEGLFECKVTWEEKGNITLVATSTDARENTFASYANIYLSDWAYWLSLSDTDRVDVIPNKTSYQVGEEAVFDVKIPFQQATALVAIEREGVIDYRVVPLGKDNPRVTLKIEPEWAPNAYVSVLSIRGRIRGEQGDSGIVWGAEPQQTGGANALVDLAKPSFRFGVTGFSIHNPEHQLYLSLSTDKPEYQIRQKAKVTVKGRLADSKPAAKANVAVFVVDKALLELSANNTTDLYKAMLRERGLSVGTATAQSEVVGRRHYGRKAIPAGGGGGRAPTRELFDTLVYWQGNAVLDEQGQATLEFTLNDSISKFEIVAVADLDQDKFGTGRVDFVSNQDLQVISGLPLVIRDQDKFEASVTVRNATKEPMQVTVKAKALKANVPTQNFADQTVNLPAMSSKMLTWAVAPISLADADRKQTLSWQFDAQANTGAVDRIRVQQELISRIPVTVRQSALMSVPASQAVTPLEVQLPVGALKSNDKLRGGVQIGLQPSLATSLDGVRNFFANYPYTCFEQRSSIAIGLNNSARWESLMSEINAHLDGYGLVKYFPSERLPGSTILTAYVLSISADARQLGWKFALPEQAQERMLNALVKVVNGNLSGYDWMPRGSHDRLRLNLIAALARYNMATLSMMHSYTLDRTYSSDSLIDLYVIIKSLKSYPNKEAALTSIRQTLWQRLDRQGTQVVFHEKEGLDDLWWMMVDRNALQAKLLFAVMDDPKWQQEIPYLVQGLVKSQRKGQWGTTSANLWSTLAMNRYTQTFEKTPASGQVNLQLNGADYAEPQKWEGLGLKQRVLVPWQGDKLAKVELDLKGKGQVWATVSALAAVQANEPQYAGYKISKTIEPVSQAVVGEWRVGDTYRVKLSVEAASSMTWVVLSDPIPTGATILGSGLGRDSIIENQTSPTPWWEGPSFIERKSEIYRAYYGYLSSGKTDLEYVVRLNTQGEFALPNTRVEGLYAPETYGELPNATIQVKGQ